MRTNWYQQDESGDPRPTLALKLEPERIIEAPIDDLPGDMAPIAAAWVAAIRGKI